VVFGTGQQALRQTLREQAALQVYAGRQVQQSLRETVGLGRPFEYPPEAVPGLVEHLFVRHHFRDEPEPESFAGVEVFAAEDDVPRLLQVSRRLEGSVIA
jgi:hypothetical protein